MFSPSSGTEDDTPVAVVNFHGPRESTKLLISIVLAAGFGPEGVPSQPVLRARMMFAIHQSYIHQLWGANSQAVSDSHVTAVADVAALQQQDTSRVNAQLRKTREVECCILPTNGPGGGMPPLERCEQSVTGTNMRPWTVTHGGTSSSATGKQFKFSKQSRARTRAGDRCQRRRQRPIDVARCRPNFARTAIPNGVVLCLSSRVLVTHFGA